MSRTPINLSYAVTFRAAALSIAVCVTGCASRPTSAVLQPVSLEKPEGKSITLLAATNRSPDAKAKGYGRQWEGDVHYERYGFSIPADRKGTAIRYPTNKPDPHRQYLITNREALSEDKFVADAVQAANFDGTVAVFVHGYNYSYQEALYRAAQLAADAQTLSPPILFSWPSAASVTGYVADRDAALSSRTELYGLLKALAASPRIERVVLFGHSMGGFLSMEAARQLKLQGRNDVVAKLAIVLAAPDIDVDVFRSQVRDLGKLHTPITLLVSNSDRALTVSSVLGGERPRVGQLNINDPLIRETAKAENVKVVDISSLQSSDGLGHDRYASLARFGGEFAKAERHGSNIGSFVFDAAGAAVASPFLLAGQVARQ